MLLQVLEIIFKVQRKMNNEKIIRREINFPTDNLFIYLWTPLIFKLHNFLISYSFYTI